jgi:hypothetical protein
MAYANREFELQQQRADAEWAAKLASETPAQRREREAFNAIRKEDYRFRRAFAAGVGVEAAKANLTLAIEEHQAALAALRAEAVQS